MRGFFCCFFLTEHCFAFDFFPAMTQLGKDRKKRIIQKVWHEGTTTELHLSVYTGVLSMLKEYVMVFQVS